MYTFCILFIKSILKHFFHNNFSIPNLGENVYKTCTVLC